MDAATTEALTPLIRELLFAGRYGELRDALEELPGAEVADVLRELPPQEAALVFRFLRRDEAGEVFAYLPAERQEELIHALGTEGSLRVVEAMDPDDRARLLDELPAEIAQRIMASLSPEDRRVTQAILGYPPESVGRLMTPDYISVRPDWTIRRVLQEIRTRGRDAETINVLYVVDDEGRLIDDLRLRQVLLADPDLPVEQIIDHQFTGLIATDDQEEAVRVMARYDRAVLPVVDSRGVLVGIVTADDVADVAEEEATEDIQKLGAVEALDEPYMLTTLQTMYRKRSGWLSILFLGQSITVFVLGAFEQYLEAVTVLMLFIPLVISCGGNSGSQAAMLATRALALREILPRDWRRIVGREIATGLALGLTLGFLGMALFYVWHTLGVASTQEPLRVALTVGGAVVGIVLWGTTAGSLLPLILQRLGFDPAVASTPLVATLMDATGIVIYFMVAILVLGGTLL
jgi:magnesium transporter